jgi:hypothetical protein
MVLRLPSDLSHVSETPMAATQHDLPSDRSVSSPSPKATFGTSNMSKFLQTGADWRAQLEDMEQDEVEADPRVLQALLDGKGADTSDLTALDTSLVAELEAAPAPATKRRVVADSDEEATTLPSLLDSIQAAVSAAPVTTPVAKSTLSTREEKKARMLELAKARTGSEAISQLADRFLSKSSAADSDSDERPSEKIIKRKKKLTKQKERKEKPEKVGLRIPR